MGGVRIMTALGVFIRTPDLKKRPYTMHYIPYTLHHNVYYHIPHSRPLMFENSQMLPTRSRRLPQCSREASLGARREPWDGFPDTWAEPESGSIFEFNNLLHSSFRIKNWEFYLLDSLGGRGFCVGAAAQKRSHPKAHLKS